MNLNTISTGVIWGSTGDSYLSHFWKKSSNCFNLEVRSGLPNSDLPPLPHQHPRKNHVAFRGTHLSMCGRNKNFTATNSEITLTYLQVWHEHKAHFTLGVRVIVQPKSSIPIGAKVEISPRCFTPQVNDDIEKKLFNLPQVTNKCWTLCTCIGPKSEKRIPSNMEGQSATLGANVPAFTNNLTSMFYHL
jgi:hypothetical protein